METLGRFDSPGARFALDNILDGAKDDTLLVWRALDVRCPPEMVWILGRKVPPRQERELQALPCALLVGDSLACIARFAPAMPDGTFDYSRTGAGGNGGAGLVLPKNFSQGG